MTTDWDRLAKTMGRRLPEERRLRIDRIEAYAPGLGRNGDREARARWLQLDPLEFRFDAITSFLKRRAVFESGLVEFRPYVGDHENSSFASLMKPVTTEGWVPMLAMCVAQVWLDRGWRSDQQLEELIGALHEGPAELERWDALWVLSQ